MRILSQRDPHWINHLLGSSKLKIGDYGCTTTCLSMASDWYHCFLDPAQIAAHKEMYTTKSYPQGAGLVIWQKVQSVFKGFKFRWRQYGEDQNKIDASLKEKDEVCLLTVPLRVGRHWLLATKKVQTKQGVDYLAADPWSGRIVLVKAAYGTIVGSVHLIKA